MKPLLIVFLVSVLAVSMESCTPKAAIPSAARLSDREYKQVLVNEKKARARLKTAALAQQNGYYDPKTKKKLSSKEWRALHVLPSHTVDSLINARKFKVMLTSGFLSRQGESGSPLYKMDHTNMMFVDGDSLLKSNMAAYFVFSSYKYDYTVLSKAKDRTRIEMKVYDSGENCTLHITIRNDGRADIIATRLYDPYSGTYKTTTGYFEGYLAPIVENDYLRPW